MFRGSQILSEDDICTSQDPLKYYCFPWAGSDCSSLWNIDFAVSASVWCCWDAGKHIASYPLRTLRRGRRFAANIAGKQLGRGEVCKRLRG